MIVTLNELLPDARREGYAVGLFNTTDTDMLEAVISAAEAERSPVIIGTAEILLPYGELSLIAPAMVAAAKAAGIRTSVDLISEPSDRYKTAVLPALPYIDILIINELEASAITGIKIEGTPTASALNAITEKLLALGVREKVILHCPAMGVIHDKENGFLAVPSLDLPRDYIVGTTGAGDAFCAGALYALTHGYTDEELLRLASLTAAASLGAADAVGGMLPLGELDSLEKRFGRKELL